MAETETIGFLFIDQFAVPALGLVPAFPSDAIPKSGADPLKSKTVLMSEHGA